MSVKFTLFRKSGLFQWGGMRWIRLFLMAAALPAALLAQAAQPWGSWQSWGDQRNGTYRNPVMPADFSDLDAIRVGRNYYAISSTLHMSPGMTVLTSADMVNWRVIGHVLPDLTALGPQYRWDRMERFGRGVWAGSIRFHAGRFRVTFGAPDEGLFTASASDPSGPWTALHPLLKGPGWNDPTMMWDDDGRAYFLATHFADGYKSYIMPMSADGRSIDRSKAVLVHEGRGREASKLIEHGGWYYIIFSEHVAGKGRYVVARRARHPMGPWSEIKQLAEPGREAYEPNQGGIIGAPSGKYYFLTHHGRQSWEGRAASLLPVSWIDGWPIIGQPTSAGTGGMVWSGAKPIHSATEPSLVASDEFSSRTLAPHWGWNHQPQPRSWSLTERRGWLRLRVLQPSAHRNLARMPNVLSQRSMRTRINVVTVRFDLSRMTDGQHAGLAHISRSFGGLGVRRSGGRRIVEYLSPDASLTGPELKAAGVWIQSRWGSDGKATFSYSSDGRRFTPFGPFYPMTHAHYRGDRIGIYTYSEQSGGGAVDVDRFRYSYSR